MDATYTMAKNVTEICYEDLPEEAVQATKKDILDTLGTALAGSCAPGCKELMRTVLETYRSAQASILVYGNKVPCPEAALVNGTFAHALDVDHMVNAMGIAYSQAVVSIRMKSGKTHSVRQEFPLGSPENPMSFDKLVDKFKRCATYAEKTFSDGVIDTVTDMVQNLESVNDVRGIIRLLV